MSSEMALQLELKTHRLIYPLEPYRSPRYPITQVIMHAQAYTGTDNKFAAVALKPENGLRNHAESASQDLPI